MNAKKHYLAWSYNLVGRAIMESYFIADRHEKMTVRDSFLAFPEDHTITARVNNSSNAHLNEDDIVYIDKLGRVNAFEKYDNCYVVAES